VTKLAFITASIAAHAAVAVVAVAGGGHAPSRGASPGAIDVELVTEAQPAPPVAETPRAEPARDRGQHLPLPAHTHPYPVAADHHARAHDPALEHPRAEEREQHREPAVTPATEAAAVVTAGAPAMPTFSISLGGATTTGGAVASTPAPASAAHAPVPSDDETPIPEAAASVRAKLAQGALPAYPPLAQSEQLEASVPLEIVVDVAGSVVEARVLEPAGNGFDAAALAAVKRYRFSPAQKNGRAVRVRMRWVVEFKLR
jgi:TonB family protein